MIASHSAKCDFSESASKMFACNLCFYFAFLLFSYRFLLQIRMPSNALRQFVDVAHDGSNFVSRLKRLIDERYASWSSSAKHNKPHSSAITYALKLGGNLSLKCSHCESSEYKKRAYTNESSGCRADPPAAGCGGPCSQQTSTRSSLAVTCTRKRPDHTRAPP